MGNGLIGVLRTPIVLRTTPEISPTLRVSSTPLEVDAERASSISADFLRDFSPPDRKFYEHGSNTAGCYPAIKAALCSFFWGVFFWSLADRNFPF